MLLALDTTGPYCSGALLNNGSVLSSRSDDIGRGHAEHLTPMLQELLAEQGVEWKNLTSIVCTTGPGSFTGLRVGLATARGLSLALDCPCHGVTVFEAFAHEVTDTLGQNCEFAVVLDAKRNQVWMQSFTGNNPTCEPIVSLSSQAAENLPTSISHMIGSGATVLSETGFQVLNENPSPSIEAVAQCGASQHDKTTRPSALYLRAPDAKPQSPSIGRV